MQLTGEDFLAGAGLALDQHRQVAVFNPHGKAQAFFQSRVEFGGCQCQSRSAAFDPPWHVQATVQLRVANLAVQQAQRLVTDPMQQRLIEHLANVFRQLTKTVQQPLPRSGVQGLQAAVVVPGEQVIGLTVDVARAAVGPQHPVTLGAAHEKCLFDFTRALHHHLPDQVLGAAVVG